VSAYFYDYSNQNAAPKRNLDDAAYLWPTPQRLFVPQVVKALRKGFVNNDLYNGGRGHGLL